VTDLRDLVWLPARFQWANGGDAVGFVPTRYVDSDSHSDDHVRLGWKTIWNEAGAGTYVGLGQRFLATDSDEYPLTKIHKIEFRHG
jgi:type VI secretion system protein ImpE